jgi:hypothetical protein
MLNIKAIRPEAQYSCFYGQNQIGGIHWKIHILLHNLVLQSIFTGWHVLGSLVVI